MDIYDHFEHRDEHYKHQEHISKLLGPQTNHKALFSAFSAIKKKLRNLRKPSFEALVSHHRSSSAGVSVCGPTGGWC